jgi:hypothetical protein
MTTGENEALERDEIEALLPWYVTGRLDGRDRQRVDAYLARHPEMQARLKLSKAERNETVFLNGPAEAPSAETVDRFMAKIARPKPAVSRERKTTASRMDGVMSWIRSVCFDPFFEAGVLQWGRIAAAALILIQAAVIVALIASRRGEDYQIARGPAQYSVSGTYVHVRFVDKAPIAKIVETMSELGMVIAEGPKAGGFFLVRIGPENMSEVDRNRAMAALKGRADVIAFVTDR